MGDITSIRRSWREIRSSLASKSSTPTFTPTSSGMPGGMEELSGAM
jgi:hypothetical protein